MLTFKETFSRTALFRIALLLCAAAFLVEGATQATNSNRWVPTPTRMTTGRSNACAVLLRDCSVLITGGNSGGATLSSAELFGPDGRFYAAAAMMDARSGHACALLPDGTVLVAGGRAAGGILGAVERFDPKAKTWKPGPRLLEPRAEATVSILKDQRVLIAGGETSSGISDSMEIYDPRAGSFQRVESRLSSPRREHAAAVLADGRVLIAGGFDGSQALDTVDLFDPASGQIAAAGKLSVPRAGLSATTLLNGRVLLLGGGDGKNETGIGEVLGFRSPTMFAADDVVYLVWRVPIVFMKEAMLTAIASTFCDESPQRLTYVTAQAGCVAAPAPSP